jgi:DNA-binding NarL/FixJ family response regulator
VTGVAKDGSAATGVAKDGNAAAGVADGAGPPGPAAGGGADGTGPAAGGGADGTGPAADGTGPAAGGTGRAAARSLARGRAAPGVVDVAAVDDHPIVLDGVASWVTAPDGGIRLVGAATTVDGLLAGPGRHAHVVLLDLDLGDGMTVERNVAAILAAGPAVLVLAASDKPVTVRAAMRAGALGYVLKDEETVQVRAAIRCVAAGQDWVSPRLAYIFATDDATDRPELSPQETRALQLYATGMPMKSVARRMAISEETVKQYVGRVREKYARAGRAAHTKLELYHRAVEDGHLPPHP